MESRCFSTLTRNAVQSHLINALKNIASLEKKRYDCDETMNSDILFSISKNSFHMRSKKTEL